MKMTVETISQFNKYCFCKFRVNCGRYHENQICEIENCEISKCSKRHPRQCIFYEQYRRCKFGDFCSYSHEVKELEAPLIIMESTYEIRNIRKEYESERSGNQNFKRRNSKNSKESQNI